MKNNFFSIWIKIIILTSVFFVIINYFWYLLNWENIKEAKASNKQTFISNDIEIVWWVWVAITTNIWIRFKERKEIPVTIYKDVVDIWYILANKNEAGKQIITNHMILLNEYLNILKTDIRSLLSSSNDRAFALNSFISQLEYRYKVGIENSKTLIIQRDQLLEAYNSSNTKIENLKNQISWDFWSFNSKAILNNVDEYLKIREENLISRTYVVFINKFLNYYAVLNNYNKNLLDALINNKEILIKNTQVVIPDTGWDLLKQLKLIYSEEEWKQ